MTSLRLVNWNLEWCKPETKKASIILNTIFHYEPDIICLTEAHTDFLPGEGDHVAAHRDYGYVDASPTQRKVILWSKQPWLEIDNLGDERMPGGRYIAAQTTTPLGRVFFRGVCIPWADAHVRTGRKDRKRWQDHNEYLEGLQRIRFGVQTEREIVIGDYNQRFPRKYQPLQSYEKLKLALTGLIIGTEGIVDKSGKAAIDHVAHSKDMTIKKYQVISRYAENGIRLSDHFGLYVELQEKAL